MTTELKLHTIRASPNNIKVRLALSLKGLQYLPVPVDTSPYPGDRSALVALSGQPLTPVLEHGDTVIFDSGAIMRYLESTFPESPRIFHPAPKIMWEIESFEWIARGELKRPIDLIFREALSPQPDLERCREASSLLHERTEAFERKLTVSPYLVGDRITAADLTAVPYVYYAMLPPSSGSSSPLAGFFREQFHLGDGREQVREWVNRVMAIDPDLH